MNNRKARKDRKGRVLKQGESQRSDGRYEFAYTLSDGNRRHIYSWRLVETDRNPAGKKPGKALRTLNEIFDLS